MKRSAEFFYETFIPQGIRRAREIQRASEEQAYTALLQRFSGEFQPYLPALERLGDEQLTLFKESEGNPFRRGERRSIESLIAHKENGEVRLTAISKIEYSDGGSFASSTEKLQASLFPQDWSVNGITRVWEEVYEGRLYFLKRPHRHVFMPVTSLPERAQALELLTFSLRRGNIPQYR